MSYQYEVILDKHVYYSAYVTVIAENEDEAEQKAIRIADRDDLWVDDDFEQVRACEITCTPVEVE